MIQSISFQLLGSLVIAATLSTAASEADSPFPTQQANSGQTGVADVAPVTKVKLKWKMLLPSLLSHQSVQTVLAPGGKTFYLTAGGTLYKVDTETGKIVVQANGNLVGHPSIAGGMLYATGANFLRAYDISGEKLVEKWTWNTPAAFDSSSKYNHAHRMGPTVTEKLILFGPSGSAGANTKLFAVDVESGKNVWTFDAKGPLRSLIALDSARNLAFIGVSGTGLAAVDLANGQEKWHANLEGTAFSGPSFSDDTVYCGNETELAAFHATDGTEVWRIKRNSPAGSKRPIGHSAIVNKDFVVVNAGPQVEAYDRKDGAFKWKYTAAGEGAGFMVAARDVLYVPDFSNAGYVHAISLKGGSKLWAHQAPEGAHKCDYVGVSDGCVYYSSLGGHLFCLENER